MGWIDRLLGRPPRPIESRDGVCVIRQRAIAEHLQRPAEGYWPAIRTMIDRVTSVRYTTEPRA